ncbi:TPA: hypothetical protein ACOEQZ_001254 [Stenotrophomonas maltophilia]|nr:hypothetical protein [Stenotrophomonas maltophilia]
MSDELLVAARDFYNATVADPAVIIRCQSAASRDSVATAGERLRLALLDQSLASVMASHPQLVPPAAAWAHEVQPEAVNGGLDLGEPGESLMAADALKHEAGVRPEGDGQATADHSAHDPKMVERVAKAMQAAEQAQSGWMWKDCSPIEVEGWMDLARAAIAALTPPKGYVPGRSVLVAATRLRKLASAATPIARSAYIKAAELVEMVAIASRPEGEP